MYIKLNVHVKMSRVIFKGIDISGIISKPQLTLEQKEVTKRKCKKYHKAVYK